MGTGLGGGILVNGDLVSGFMHPEIGHMRIPSNGVAGSCPFHGNCLEGLLGKIRIETEKRLSDYLPIDSRVGGIEKLIVLPSLADQSGLTGALLLAKDLK